MQGAKTRKATAIAASLTLLSVVGISTFAGSAEAGSQLISCAPTRADVAAVSVDNLRLGLADTYAWATATIRLLMRDQSTQTYALQGRADPIAKQLPPNAATPGFSYPGFVCTVQYAAINSVRNCHGGKNRRTCEIGMQILGSPAAYSVSMTAQRVRVREAALP